MSDEKIISWGGLFRKYASGFVSFLGDLFDLWAYKRAQSRDEEMQSAAETDAKRIADEADAKIIRN